MLHCFLGFWGGGGHLPLVEHSAVLKSMTRNNKVINWRRIRVDGETLPWPEEYVLKSFFVILAGFVLCKLSVAPAPYPHSIVLIHHSHLSFTDKCLFGHYESVCIHLAQQLHCAVVYPSMRRWLCLVQSGFCIPMDKEKAITSYCSVTNLDTSRIFS